MVIKQTTTTKKNFTIEGDCLEQVEAVLINQKQIKPGLLTITPTKITVTGKSKKLGIKGGAKSATVEIEEWDDNQALRICALRDISQSPSTILHR